MSQEDHKKLPPSSRHDLDDSALGAWLMRDGMIPNLTLPIKSSKIGYGQSNPTYFVDDARYVVFPILPLHSIHTRPRPNTPRGDAMYGHGR